MAKRGLPVGFNRLVMFRAKGSYGPFFQPARPGTAIKTTGNYYAPGAPGSGVSAVSLVLTDSTTVTVYFSGCVDISAVDGIEYQVDGGGWVEVLGIAEVSSSVWSFTTAEIAPTALLQWRYIGGEDSIVDCVETSDVGALSVQLVIEPEPVEDAVLLESGDAWLTEDDVGGSSFVLLEG
jgi:hypothetical protein